MRDPLRFQPFLRPMVWGGRLLQQFLEKSLPTPESYGESWEISDHPSHLSLVHTGPHAGRTLRQLVDQDSHALIGDSSVKQFPWLVKFLDAHDWLSVQVHPDEEKVRHLLPGEGSKTEAWFIVATQPNARIYAGLRPGVDEKVLRKALEQGTVADCLHSFVPSPGDCLFLPAGTVHAVGGGVLIAEVQQTSDATFRLFDWNRRDASGRSRALHIDQSLASINWQAGPVHPERVQPFPQTSHHNRPLVRCDYFHLDYASRNADFTLGGTGRLQVAVILHGKAEMRTRYGAETLHPGDTVLFPASGEAVPIHPRGSIGVLLSTLPAGRAKAEERAA